ncbi:MAG: hypothetical protein KBE23_16270 [Chloroflexi bacterium]|nr:hypothetical protein [Chloroflexota bacterium]MBP7044307.1 hypothetical protein [Chloroflexota bacterium]
MPLLSSSCLQGGGTTGRLDVRLGWSNVSALVSILANVVVFAGYMIFVWVMIVSSYLSRTVEVDAD